MVLLSMVDLNCLKSIAMQKKCLLHLNTHILTTFLLTHLILLSLKTPSFAFLLPLLIVIRQVNLGNILVRLLPSLNDNGGIPHDVHFIKNKNNPQAPQWRVSADFFLFMGWL